MITANRTVFYTALLSLSCAFAAPVALAEGNAKQGELLAYSCMGCHGIEGYRNAYPSFRVPKLGGQKAGYIETALKAYRDGTRPHPTMQAQGSSLSDQDIEDLAAYFQGEEKASDEVTAEDLSHIENATTCLTCHGAQSEDGLVPVPPTLSGQWESYLVHALNEYRSGKRTGTIMSGFAGSLTDEQIAALARLYSRRDGLDTPQKEE